MSECVFCKIAKKELPAEIVYESEDIIAFKDIKPKAPHHILIIPKKHIPTLDDVKDEDYALIGKMFLVARDIARSIGVSEKGYRTVFNCKSDGGQEVYHLHLHLLGGRKMHWPPG
jgi:histidine triad (HIT) family protein